MLEKKTQPNKVYHDIDVSILFNTHFDEFFYYKVIDELSP